MVNANALCLFLKKFRKNVKVRLVYSIDNYFSDQKKSKEWSFALLIKHMKLQ